MENKPIATVIIVTRNRPEMLKNTLQETRKQTGYRDFEIVVVNDGGEKSVKGMLGNLFPEIEVIDVIKQQGYIALRNKFFKNAKSNFVFFLDDDSWFEDNGAVVRAIGFFNTYPMAAILSFKVTLPGGNTIPRELLKEKPYEVGRYMGCAHAIRKSYFNDMEDDLYDKDYFRQGEERDLAIKCLDKGYSILQINDINVYHEESNLNRDHQFIHGYAFRNELFFYVKFFPITLLPFFMIRCVGTHTIFCLKKRWFKAYYFGLSGFIKDFFKFSRKRYAVKPKTVKKYTQLNMEK